MMMHGLVNVKFISTSFRCVQ